mmetsp:Transcript_45859/g.114024  ORF Transcript_45859/g.114024 Transcript_45859/m.114024 type:complete len:192 (+) Transcript_45859:1342-1917(+)
MMSVEAVRPNAVLRTDKTAKKAPQSQVTSLSGLSRRKQVAQTPLSIHTPTPSRTLTQICSSVCHLTDVTTGRCKTLQSLSDLGTAERDVASIDEQNRQTRTQTQDTDTGKKRGRDGHSGHAHRHTGDGCLRKSDTHLPSLSPSLISSALGSKDRHTAVLIHGTPLQNTPHPHTPDTQPHSLTEPLLARSTS